MAISLPLPRRQRRDPEAELDYRQHTELNTARQRLADVEQRMPAAIQLAQDTASGHRDAQAEVQQLEDLQVIGRASDDQVAQARQKADGARRSAVQARVDVEDLQAAFADARAKHADLDASAKAQAIAGLQSAHSQSVQKLVAALLEARAQGLEIRRLVELADSQFPEGHSGNNSGQNAVTAMRDVAWSELDAAENVYNPSRLGSWLQELAEAGLVETKTIAPVLGDEDRARKLAAAQLLGPAPATTSAPVQQRSADPMIAELVADDSN